MGRRCCVPNCDSGKQSCKEKVFTFGAPRDPQRLQAWTRAIPGMDRDLTSTDYVCVKHFATNMVRRGRYYCEVAGEVVLDKPKKPSLHPDAVPSIFPTCPLNVSCRKKRRREPKITTEGSRTRVEVEELDDTHCGISNGVSSSHPETEHQSLECRPPEYIPLPLSPDSNAHVFEGVSDVKVTSSSVPEAADKQCSTFVPAITEIHSLPEVPDKQCNTTFIPAITDVRSLSQTSNKQYRTFFPAITDMHPTSQASDEKCSTFVPAITEVRSLSRTSDKKCSSTSIPAISDVHSLSVTSDEKCCTLVPAIRDIQAICNLPRETRIWHKFVQGMKVALPSRTWHCRDFSADGIESLCFIEVRKESAVSPVFVNKSLELTMSQEGLRVKQYVLEREVSSLLVNVDEQLQDTPDIAGMLITFHKKSVCRGGPAGVKFPDLQPHCASIDKTGTWRHRKCPLLLEASERQCASCRGLGHTLQVHRARTEKRGQHCKRVRIFTACPSERAKIVALRNQRIACSRSNKRLKKIKEALESELERCRQKAKSLGDDYMY